MKKLSALITGGATREYLDPVRFISNASSGAMARAIAGAALADGAKTTCVSGPGALLPPRGARLVSVVSALEMRSAVMRLLPAADVFVSCAAVTDFRPEKPRGSKIKKTGAPLALKLVQNPDILAQAAARAGNGKLIVGFALETENLRANARKKLFSKKLDLIVANPASCIGSGKMEGFILFRSGRREKVPLMTKEKFSALLWRRITEAYAEKTRQG